MNDEHFTFALPGNRTDKITQKFVTVLVINADTRFDGDRDRYHVAHRFNAISNALRIRHQTCAEHTVLHPIRRATDVQVNFIVATFFSQFRALCQRGRVTSA
ncbi:hypothetical protein D3C75_616130 [compost metagenome]